MPFRLRVEFGAIFVTRQLRLPEFWDHLLHQPLPNWINLLVPRAFNYFYFFGHQFRILVAILPIDYKEGVVIPQASPFSRTGHFQLTIISTSSARKHEKWTRMTFPLLWKSKSKSQRSSILSPHRSVILYRLLSVSSYLIIVSKK